jgi:hypothetical protein
MHGFAAPRRRVVNIMRVTVLGCAALATSPANTPVLPPLVLPAPMRQLHDLFPVTPISELQHVWRAEEGDGYEVYSNGLRIENTFVAPSRTRGQYFAYRRDPGTWGVIRHPAFPMTNPAGIVFHQTESLQAAFEQSQARRLTRIGRELLEFVRRRHCYHFVVDRFGRVWRIVPEADVAFHSGHSVWADQEKVYVNLNSSFLGVALESAGSAPPSGAQVHSLRVLVEWLRSRYSIPASNCVAHAQVSVNPKNMRIGYHTDWANGFPFAAVGLPDNYRAAVPAVSLFGFEADALLVEAAGGRPWPGIQSAEEQVRQWAALSSLSEREFRRRLQEQFRSAGHDRAAQEREENGTE